MIREEEGEREGVEEDKGGRKVGEIKEKKEGIKEEREEGRRER